jgi:cysteine-rich repeat protein
VRVAPIALLCLVGCAVRSEVPQKGDGGPGTNLSGDPGAGVAITGRVEYLSAKLAGALVTGVAGAAVAATEDDGTFALLGAPSAGDVLVHTDRDGDGQAELQIVVHYDGGPTDLGDLSMPAAAAIVGHVTLNGAPAPRGTLVAVQGMPWVVETDASGAYVLGPIAGSPEWTVIAGNTKAGAMATAAPVALPAGDSATVDLRLTGASPSDLLGRILGPDDTPAAGAAVETIGGAAKATSGADGTYTLSGVRAGLYLVRAASADRGETTPVAVLAGGASSQALGDVHLLGGDTQNDGPVIHVTSPAPGEQLTGAISIQADVAGPRAITAAEFFLDDLVIAQASAPPFQTSFTAASQRAGPHVLTVVGRDVGGIVGVTSQAIDVGTVCGDGVRQGTEACDDGSANDEQGTCRTSCVVAVCGDGVVLRGTEQCDDGNTIEGDGCDSNCTRSACGNGVRAGSEQCDDGNTVNGDGCDTNCTITACGNGIRTGVEECDDGNTATGDGCDASCVAEHDTWWPLPPSGAVAPHGNMFWTGADVYFWPGAGTAGARFTPATETWAAFTAPSPGPGGPAIAPNALWSGARFYTWGGHTINSSPVVGGIWFDPTTNTTGLMSTTGGPGGFYDASFVSTGSTLVFYGGDFFVDPNTFFPDELARYDVASDKWTTSSATTNKPQPRGLAGAVWTGVRLVIWAGQGAAAFLNDGGRYDPVGDVWESMSSAGAPSARSRPTAVWSGSYVVVFGGSATGNTPATGGGRYDPVNDVWLPMAAEPFALPWPLVAWTGTEMLAWSPTARMGAAYDPASNQWRALSLTRAPATATQAVWTGSRMIVTDGQSCTAYRP